MLKPRGRGSNCLIPSSMIDLKTPFYLNLGCLSLQEPKNKNTFFVNYSTIVHNDQHHYSIPNDFDCN